jgi:hypothetical protein
MKKPPAVVVLVVVLALLASPTPSKACSFALFLWHDFGARIDQNVRDPIYADEDTLPTIWEVARSELGIPQVAPAEAPVRQEGEEP